MAGIDFGSFFGGSSSSGGLAGLYSDYYAIRNGSYKKLMRAYYGGSSSSKYSSKSGSRSSKNVLDEILQAKRNQTVSKATAEANSALNAGISSLKSSLAALQNENTYSDTDGTAVSDKVANALKDYVQNYNSTVTASKKSTNSGMTDNVAMMMKTTAANKDGLAAVGITINHDGTLTLSESAAKAAKPSAAKDLFSSENRKSYGSTVAMYINGAGYYASSSNTSTKTTESKAADTENAKDTSASSADLKSDIAALTGDKLFATTKSTDDEGNDTESYDLDAIFTRVSSFAKNYNDLIAAARLSGNEGVAANLGNLLNKTKDNVKSLNEIGITVDKNGNLSVNEKSFKAADMAKAQKTLKSYASAIENNASLVKYYATTGANSSSGYTANGTYNASGLNGFSGTV